MFNVALLCILCVHSIYPILLHVYMCVWTVLCVKSLIANLYIVCSNRVRWIMIILNNFWANGHDIVFFNKHPNLQIPLAIRFLNVNLAIVHARILSFHKLYLIVFVFATKAHFHCKARHKWELITRWNEIIIMSFHLSVRNFENIIVSFVKLVCIAICLCKLYKQLMIQVKKYTKNQSISAVLQNMIHNKGNYFIIFLR